MAKPDRAWVTDIIYLRTAEGRLYLAVVRDPYSCAVVGWSMEPTLSEEPAGDELLMAIRRYRLAGPVMIHSGQGVPYGGDDWQC